VSSPPHNTARHRGIIPALLTPFSEDYEIDHRALALTVERLTTAGVDGMVANGTLAEAQSMSPSEQQAAARTVVSAAAGRIPVTVGISAGATREVLSMTEVALEIGGDAVMCLPPLSYRASEVELMRFFLTVADAGALPMMIYNNPATSKNDLKPALIAELANHPQIVSVKECSGDARRIAAIANLAPDTFDVLVGGDDWALEGLSAGATGWVSGVANVAPIECLELVSLVNSGQMDEARARYSRMLPLARLDMTDKLVQYFKAALDRLGLGGGPCRLPRLDLEDNELESLIEAVDILMGSSHSLAPEAAR
jgi:4-hydroxy-tetrahydrodipicolinate synthase